MSLKAKLEAIIYAAETPITLDHIVQLVKESVVAENAAGDAEDAAEVKSRVRAALEELIADYAASSHGSEIRGVDSNGVIATLLDRKLITTAGRKAVIGRPILYKSTKEFLLRFGLKDVGELPSMEEFEKLVAESFQSEMLPLSDGGTEVGISASVDATAGEVASESEPVASDGELEGTSAEPPVAGEPVAGEKEPAA